MKLTTVRRLI